MKNKLTMLMILDGFGLSDELEGNAIKAADTDNIDRLIAQYPNSRIKCSGLDVGLPEGQMGNSEVGHTNMGAGRIVYQDFTRITKSIENDEFYDNPTFLEALKNCKENNSKLHLLGLLSDGGVHSHNSHLYALLDLAKKQGLKDVCVHCFLDGRDVPPSSGVEYVKQLSDKLNEIGIGKIATVMGRYFAMDRDNRWERVKKAYEAMALGKGLSDCCPVTAVKESYQNSVTDEFVVPTVITEDNNPVGLIEENDSIIFFNFRPDRAREITRTFVDPEFEGFEREKGYFKLFYVCFTQYDAMMPNVKVAFKPQNLKNTLGEYLSVNNYTQLRIAETEKYAHVTFFFNGGVEKIYKGEDRILIPSPQVDTYDLKPEMSAYEVTEVVIEKIKELKYDVIVLNFANCDMVGHTGVFDAAIKAVEAVDECVGRIYETVSKVNGTLMITSDHGNSDKMLDEITGGTFTAHTTSEVPLVLCDTKYKLNKQGKLADIAPTMLDIMGIEKPAEMIGESLIIK